MEFYGTFVVRHQQVNNFGQTGKLETLNTLNCSLSPTNYLMLKKNQDFDAGINWNLSCSTQVFTNLFTVFWSETINVTIVVLHIM